ncbi:tRNA(fMet)-specific endonuclease VapC [Bacteroidia bacterium]|nr:tRNA(fMet)-specific endonuclease VapC [Bacteroidia bacterium]
MKYLLDTNICAFHLRGKLNLVDNLLKELTILPIISCVDVYSKEKVRLRRSGKPVNDEFDLLIGATAIKNKLILVTDNVKDFERLDGIKIENWMHSHG